MTATPLLAAFCEAANARAVTGEPNVIVVGTMKPVLYVHVLFEPVAVEAAAEVTLPIFCLSFAATTDAGGHVFGTGVMDLVAEDEAADAAANTTVDSAAPIRIIVTIHCPNLADDPDGPKLVTGSPLR
jgi:hypothetical protein